MFAICHLQRGQIRRCDAKANPWDSQVVYAWSWASRIRSLLSQQTVDCSQILAFETNLEVGAKICNIHAHYTSSTRIALNSARVKSRNGCHHWRHHSLNFFQTKPENSFFRPSLLRFARQLLTTFQLRVLRASAEKWLKVLGHIGGG